MTILDSLYNFWGKKMLSLKLSTEWDLTIDETGNFKTTQTEAERCAQDVACAIKTFKNECYFNQTSGVPYFNEILAKIPSEAVICSIINKRAETVEGVKKASLTITGVSGRVLNGDILLTLQNGEQENVTI